MIECNVGFRILSDEQARRIEAAAMKVLRETGCDVVHPGALEMLAAAGARVEGSRVRMGEDLVRRALESAPRRIVLGDRKGQPAMDLSGRNVHFGTGSDCIFVLDGAGGRRRRSMLADTRRFAALADRLGQIDFVMSMACPEDVPPDRLYREQFAAMLLATSKPIVFTVVDPAELAPILEMSALAQGGMDMHRAAPHLLLYAEPISPLVHPATSVEKLLFCAANGVPVTYSPGSMAGGTTPVTAGGTLVQSVAEILSGLVMHQLACPGAPFVFGGAIGPMDMKTTLNVYAAPFGASWGAALVEIGRRLGLPTWSTAGCSDSKCLDEQSAIDSSLTTLYAALSGANVVHDVGYIESGKTSSLEMLVMSAEVVRIVQRMVEGIDTSDCGLALDAISRVGPGGNFMTDDHTLANFREAMFQPELMDYLSHDAWRAGGATSLVERATRRIADLEQMPPAGAADDDLCRGIEQILRA
jgi:trimethylamine--corrinoid protein Co-methyltransferase